MLVSSITRFDSHNSLKNSYSQPNNSHAFGGEHDLSMLNKMDKKFGLDLLTNKLLYKMAYLQEKVSAKHANKLNVLA